MTLRALYFCLLLAPFASAEAQSLPDGCAIVPQSQGPALMRQCSRLAPRDVGGFWTPSVAQVRAIEQQLPDLLRRSGHAIKLPDSRRQYIGITSHGKRLIYLNAFPAFALDFPDHTDWRKTAFTACDGGDVFWGVEFDPAKNAFQDLQFNGDA